MVNSGGEKSLWSWHAYAAPENGDFRFYNKWFIPQCVWNILQRNTCLTHWGRDKMAAIVQTMFSYALSWMKRCELRWISHWSSFLRVQLTISQHWFRQWLAPGPPMMVIFLTNICVTRPQWVNTVNVYMPFFKSTALRFVTSMSS